MLRRFPWQVTAIAALGALAHVVTITRYGIFRDELYYVACGRHLAWGYVDHPPLVGVLAWIATELFGGSLPALRVIPIACGVATVLVTASLVRRLGGGVWAQAAAALCITIAPHYLFAFHILSMNAPEILLWALAARLTVEALEPGARWPWIALGAVVGVGLLTKHSMAFWALGLFAGIVVTPARVVLRTRWPWLGAALAATLFVPHVVWQMRHGWPVLEFVRNAQTGKIVPLSPFEFLGAQVEMLHPLAAPVWIVGLVWGLARLRRPSPVAAAVFACAWCVVLVLFVAQRSKAYYLTPAYPALFATGAVAIERWRSAVARPLRIAAPVVWLAGGLVTAPFVLPILAPEQFVRYRDALGVESSASERHEMGELPQHFADMHGWEEMARTVAEAYAALPAAERDGARFYGQNYGEAGAIDWFRGRYDLPPAISGHNNYWLWGPGAPSSGPVFILGGELEDHQRVFARVDSIGFHDAAYAMPYERRLTLWAGRAMRVDIADAWARSRHFN